MFTTLPETRAHHQRRVGGAIVSLLVHGALVAGAVAATFSRADGSTALPPSVPRDTLVYVPVTHRQPAARNTPATSGASAPAIPAVPQLPALPNVEVPPPGTAILVPGLTFMTDTLFGPARGLTAAGGATPGAGVSSDGVIGERDVDRAPNVIGTAPTPRYPESLRAAGITGRVVVQFVVDTTGRAEPGLEVLGPARAEFVEAVRAVLTRYRFSAGEAAGHKVRTRVQVPFDFTLR